MNLSSQPLNTCVSSESRMSHNSLTAIASTHPHDQHNCLHTYQLSYKSYYYFFYSNHKALNCVCT